jgi:hypothetical protein
MNVNAREEEDIRLLRSPAAEIIAAATAIERRPA